MMCAATLVMALGAAGVASAQSISYYQPQDNIVVNLDAPVGLPNLGTGSLTYGLQQGLHALVQGAIGTDVSYDYLVLDLNGTSLAYIDPFCAYR